MTRKALGKGLDALFSTPEVETSLVEQEKEIQPTTGVWEVEINKIRDNPYQPRNQFNEEKLNELVESIKERGILQPILLRPVGDDNYEIIAGERRYRAALLAGLDKVPAIVVKATNRDSLEMALIENLQREDLNPIELAKGFKMLQEEFGLAQEEVAQRVGLSREAVSNTLRLLQLPMEVKQLIEKGELSAGHSRVLLRLDSEHEQIRLAHLILKKGLSVRETEKMIESGRQKKKPRGKSRKFDTIFELKCRETEELLLEYLDTLVKVKPLTNKKGKIEIYFNGINELESILNRLGHRD